MMTISSTHKILIVGGGVAGISEAHYLLRHVLPFLSKELRTAYKVILLSASSHFYWKVGAPRGLVTPSLISLSESLIPVTDGFQEYDPSIFEFVQGTAFRLDAPARTLQVRSVSDELSEIYYDSLVVATGAASKSPLYSLVGHHELTKNALASMHTRLTSARTILVAGGGPAGTETAGELGAEFGGRHEIEDGKDITILSGNSRLLPRLNALTSADAEAKLKQLGVKIRHNVRVKSTLTTTNGDGPTKVLLSDDSEMMVDVYIDATGCIPNTAFLPSMWLNEGGFIKTNSSTLRLEVPETSNVYALGAVTCFTNGSFFDVVDAVRPLAESIRLDLLTSTTATKAKTLDNTNNASWWFWLSSSSDPLKRRLSYKQKKADTQFVPCGRDGGVGVLHGWRVPNRMVYSVKAKTFMIEKARPIVEGADFRAA